MWLFAALVFFSLVACFETPHRVLKENMPPILFINGERTARHRGEAVPQMVCKRGNPDLARTAMCEVAGGKGDNVIFKCQMELPDGLKLGKFEVGCEGWAGPDDNYWATGTCQLEYEIVGVATTPVPPGNVVHKLSEHCLNGICHSAPGSSEQTRTTIETTTVHKKSTEDDSPGAMLAILLLFFGVLFFAMIVAMIVAMDRSATVPHPIRPPPAVPYVADYYEPAYCYRVPRRSRQYYYCSTHSDLDFCTTCLWIPFPFHRRPETTTTTTTTIINNANSSSSSSSAAAASAPTPRNMTLSGGFGKSKTRGSSDEGSTGSTSSWSGDSGGGSSWSSGSGGSGGKSSGFGKSKTR